MKDILTEKDFFENFDFNDISADDEENLKNPKAYKYIPFEIKGMKYKLEIDTSEHNKKKIADIKFYLLNNPNSPKRIDFNSEQQYQIALKTSQVGIAGVGNQFKVFSKVLSLLNRYTEQENITYLCFTANEQNRQRLYRKISDTLLHKMRVPYKQLKNNPITGESLSSEEFWLERI